MNKKNCPICGNPLPDNPAQCAVSRVDENILICPDCGKKEAEAGFRRKKGRSIIHKKTDN